MNGQSQKRARKADEHTSITETSRGKVRKGTQSCRECKKRKIKCTRSNPFDSVCDGCRSRNTSCVGQDMEDHPSNATKSTFATRNFSANAMRLLDTNDHHGLIIDRLCAEHKRPDDMIRVFGDMLGKGALVGLQVDMAIAMIRYWPSSRDASRLSDNAAALVALSHGMVCAPYQKHFASLLPDSTAILVWPHMDSSPVITAKRFMMLAVYLQALPPKLINHISTIYRSSHGSRHGFMTFAQMRDWLIDAATKHVIGNSELLSSIEGIECVMLQSMYLNNAGNLRGAWLANRRAISLAQVLALDTSGKLTRSMVIEASTMHRVDSGSMWLRLVATDRYLSLMLGLPQASCEDLDIGDGDWGAIGYRGMDLLERATAKAAGLMLSRKPGERANMKQTMKIDVVLRKAANFMEADWWTASSRGEVGDGSDLTLKTFLWCSLRTVLQLAHYHMIVHLHLPFLLAKDDPISPRYAYSKLAVVTASREIIRLYINTRGDENTTSYCRGADFVAFTASIALIFAHLEAHQQTNAEPNSLQSLHYQRQTDLGLINQIHAMWSQMYEHEDAIAEQLLGVLDQLLKIQYDVDENTRMATEIEMEGDGASRQRSHSCVLQTCGGLELHIPHIGALTIRRRRTFNMATQAGDEEQNAQPGQLQDQSDTTEDDGQTSLNDLLQGVDAAFFQNLGTEWDHTGLDDLGGFLS